MLILSLLHLDATDIMWEFVDEHVIRGSYVRAYGMWPGELNCYHTSSRARLFARLQSSVSSLFDLRNVMDYNSFQKDPESVGDACEVRPDLLTSLC